MFKSTTFTRVKRAIVLSFITLGSAMAVNAATVTFTDANGIKLKSTDGKTAIVQKPATTEPQYSGDIVVTSPVTHEGVTYQVVSAVAAAFKNNTNITSVVLPDDFNKLLRGQFQGCTALKSVKLSPNISGAMVGNAFTNCSSLEEISIPGAITTINSAQFSGCTSLKKITLEESDTELVITVAAFGTQKSVDEGGTGDVPVEEVVINRPVSAELPANAPFRGEKTLTKVTFGPKLTSLSASYFENCTALATVELPATITELGTSVFQNTGISTINVPGSIASIPETVFANCASLAAVTLSEGVTSIRGNAFKNSPITSVALPATLESIGVGAFSGCGLQGDIVIPAAVTSIGADAFVGNTGITSVAFPASLTSLGEGAFNGCSGIANFTVDAANTSYKVKSHATLTSFDGTKALAYPVANANTVVNDPEITALGAYAFNGAKNLTEITIDNCANFGNYSLANTGIVSAKVRGTMGRYVLQGCTSLKDVELTINPAAKEVPHGLCSGCTALEKITLSDNIINLKAEAFANCASLKEINLGGLLCIIEADAFAGCGVETLISGSKVPASMTEGVFTEANSGITVKVPVDCVDAYKAAAGWRYLNVVGDANIAAAGNEIGMPKGLYYAGKDSKLHGIAEDGTSTVYYEGIPHTFQLTEFKDRIYGASGGVKFTYEGTPVADGKLFYISQIDGNTFQGVVIDNAGGNAYEDPMGLYIYGDTLYVNDRNVSVRKVSADAIALPLSYPSWMENNWLGYYGSPWAYGCIKSGFAITQDQDENGNPEPLYWLSMRYNGNGLFTFKEKHIDASKAGSVEKPDATQFPEMLTNIALNASTFYIDDANDHFYIYIAKASGVNSGLYRIKLSDLKANPNPGDWSELNPVVVDGAPILLEGADGSQETGITQLSPSEDGYLYWCYISPGSSSETVKLVGTPVETYSAENPLHKSGIKRIKLGDETPVVEMVVEGVEGYGVVPVGYASSGVSEVVASAAADRLQVIGDAVTVLDDAVVSIYNAGGALVNKTATSGVKSISLRDMSAGLYVVEAVFADGAREVVKVVK